MGKVCRALSVLPVILLLMLAIPPLLGIQALAVLGGSMEPNIRAGDLIYVKENLPEEIEVGDIITFLLPGGVPATHRVVGVEREQAIFFTKGDANRDNDAPVPFNRLVGRVVFSLPYAGRLAVALKGGYSILLVAGMLLLLALCALLTVIFPKAPPKKGTSHTTHNYRRQG